VSTLKVGNAAESCNYEDVDVFNRNVVLPKLKALIGGRTEFFRFWRVALCDECAHENIPPPMCGSPECSVCECDENDVPCDTSGRCYLQDIPHLGADGVEPCFSDARKSPGTYDMRIDFNMNDGEFSRWDAHNEADESWITSSKDGNDGDDSYVDLTKNPERWTGYTALQNSTEIWRAIYEENCFTFDDAQSDAETCQEVVAFNKIISGFHASVSTHIAADFCLEIDKISARCVKFGPSSSEFARKVGSHSDRVDNLYFLYLFMIRAANKASDLLLRFDYDAGNRDEVSYIRRTMGDLSESISDRNADVPCVFLSGDRFDENAMFVNERATLRNVFRGTFRNISSIMNCVGCEKCKLWGKLQLEGIGVAMKILFAKDTDIQSLHLSRTEMVAFVNALHQFSKSIEYVSTTFQDNNSDVVEVTPSSEFRVENIGIAGLFAVIFFLSYVALISRGV